MSQKLALVTVLAVLLGGCSLTLPGMGNQAASDSAPSPVAQGNVSESATPDTKLEAIPSPGTGTDTTSLEKDLNDTQILDEDFSNLN